MNKAEAEARKKRSEKQVKWASIIFTVTFLAAFVVGGASLAGGYSILWVGFIMVIFNVGGRKVRTDNRNKNATEIWRCVSILRKLTASEASRQRRSPWVGVGVGVGVSEPQKYKYKIFRTLSPSNSFTPPLSCAQSSANLGKSRPRPSRTSCFMSVPSLSVSYFT